MYVKVIDLFLDTKVKLMRPVDLHGTKVMSYKFHWDQADGFYAVNAWTDIRAKLGNTKGGFRGGRTGRHPPPPPPKFFPNTIFSYYIV